LQIWSKSFQQLLLMILRGVLPHVLSAGMELADRHVAGVS
jgi:hypothetical protein